MVTSGISGAPQISVLPQILVEWNFGVAHPMLSNIPALEYILVKNLTEPAFF